MAPSALNPDLEKLLRESSVEERHLPLAIRRFMETMGASEPGAAMHIATQRALSRYTNSFRDVGLPRDLLDQEPTTAHAPRGCVSVERLCSVLNVDLVGVPQRTDRSKREIESTPYAKHGASVKFTSPRPVINLSSDIGWARGRVAAAHEIGHVLIHRRDFGYDQATIRLGSTPAEEALAEYAARLLLVPLDLFGGQLEAITDKNYAVRALTIAQYAQVTLHTAAARLGDPDVSRHGIRGVIFWRVQNRRGTSAPPMEVLTPQWHLCPDAYIPVGRCKAGSGSLVQELSVETTPVAGTRVESVAIGGLRGTFIVDAFAWGSRADKTRVVMSVFRSEQ